MAEMTSAYDWQGRDVVDDDGEKIGSVEELYYDRNSNEPEWLAVKTGLFGTNVSFVPVQGAQPSGEEVRVAFDKAQVKDAPNMKPDGELSPEEEQRLYEHYGLSYGDGAAGYGDARETDGYDTSGPTTDDAMTRSEEELRVGTEQRERGRARLRKYVVTEEVQKTVPLQREEVRVEREPITDANVGDATDGPAISEEEHEVVLHEEEPVVEKRAVPKERVRLDKETVTDDREIREEVRKEQIEADDEVR
jgi:uncharacterized protein (TIGR02271 family)